MASSLSSAFAGARQRLSIGISDHVAEPCGVCLMADKLLDAAGISWAEVFVGGGVAAVMAEQGIAALAAPAMRWQARPWNSWLQPTAAPSGRNQTVIGQ